jgi:hypothetical protein
VKSTFTNSKTSVTLYSCKELSDWRGFSVNIYRFVTLFALPSVVMIVCYLWVIIELWISTKTMDELTQNWYSYSFFQSIHMFIDYFCIHNFFQ